MHCPECGNNLNGLEERCREEFKKKHGQYFHNLEVARAHQWYWRGAWIGIAIDLLVLCFLVGMGGWSWDGFLEIVHRVSEKSYLLLFMPFLIPFMCAMSCSVLSFARVDVEEEQAYRTFKETWGLPGRCKGKIMGAGCARTE